MKINKIPKKIGLEKFRKSSTKKIESKIQIKDYDDDSEVIHIDKIGITPLGQGAVILKTDNGKEFPISSFSSDTARNISDFQEGKLEEMPSIYRMLEQICEDSEIFLVKVRLYPSGQALRANLYFSGKKELVIRNYRASDAIALATLYSIPILLKKDMLPQSPKINR